MKWSQHGRAACQHAAACAVAGAFLCFLLPLPLPLLLSLPLSLPLPSRLLPLAPLPSPLRRELLPVDESSSPSVSPVLWVLLLHWLVLRLPLRDPDRVWLRLEVSAVLRLVAPLPLNGPLPLSPLTMVWSLPLPLAVLPPRVRGAASPAAGPPGVGAPPRAAASAGTPMSGGGRMR